MSCERSDRLRPIRSCYLGTGPTISESDALASNFFGFFNNRPMIVSYLSQAIYHASPRLNQPLTGACMAGEAYANKETVEKAIGKSASIRSSRDCSWRNRFTGAHLRHHHDRSTQDWKAHWPQGAFGLCPLHGDPGLCHLLDQPRTTLSGRQSKAKRTISHARCRD